MCKTSREKLEVDGVLLCKLNLLGDKTTGQFRLVETSAGKNLLSERTKALNIEDLKPVMKRVAISIAKFAPFNANTDQLKNPDLIKPGQQLKIPNP